jgi:hypothetical protein
MTLNEIDFKNLNDAILGLVRESLEPYRSEIIAIKLRERAELAAARRPRVLSQLRAQQPDTSNYEIHDDDHASPEPASWENIDGDKKNLERRISGIFDKQILPRLTEEVERERAEGKQSSLLEKYQKAKEVFMSAAPATARQRYSRMAMQNCLDARSRGQELSFREELERLSGTAKTSQLPNRQPDRYLKAPAALKYAAPKPPPSGMPTVYKPLIVLAREIAIQRVGNDSTRLSPETQKVVRELMEALAEKRSGKAGDVLYSQDPVEQHLFSQAVGSLSQQASNEAMKRVLSKRGRGEAVEYRDELLATTEEIRREAFDNKSYR